MGADPWTAPTSPPTPTPHGGIGRTPPLSPARNKGGRSTAFWTSRRWPRSTCPTVSLSPLPPGENKRMTLGILRAHLSPPSRRVSSTLSHGKEGSAHWLLHGSPRVVPGFALRSSRCNAASVSWAVDGGFRGAPGAVVDQVLEPAARPLKRRRAARRLGYHVLARIVGGFFVLWGLGITADLLVGGPIPWMFFGLIALLASTAAALTQFDRSHLRRELAVPRPFLSGPLPLYTPVALVRRNRSHRRATSINVADRGALGRQSGRGDRRRRRDRRSDGVCPGHGGGVGRHRRHRRLSRGANRGKASSRSGAGTPSVSRPISRRSPSWWRRSKPP